jgi:hypothetical protein
MVRALVRPHIRSMTRQIAVIVAFAGAVLFAAPSAGTDLLSRIPGSGSSLGEAGRQGDAFVRRQLESDLRAARQEQLRLDGRRPFQQALGLDDPGSGAYADFRDLEADIRRLEREQRTLERQIEAREDAADRAVDAEVYRPPAREPFPDAASFDIPRALWGVEVLEDAPPPDVRGYVNRLLEANRDREY